MESCFQRTFVGNATDRKTDSSGAWPAYQHTDSSGEPCFRLSTAASFHDDSLVPPHPSQRSALPPQDQFGDARFPVLITQDPRASSQVVGTDPRGHVPLNISVPVETDTFVGRMCNLIKGCPGTPDAEFRGTKAYGKSIIQGMYKTETPAKDIWVGQELLKQPLLPASFQRLVFTTAAKMFSSTYRVMVEGDALGYLNPLLAIAATINVSLPGQQPDLRNVHEDARLLDPRLADKSGQPVSSAQRQRFFDKVGNLEGAKFSTQYVYTFIITQSIVDMPTYKLKLGAFINLDLCPVLNGQPLQMMCKNVQTEQVIMSLLVWHKHLNYPPSRQRRQSDADTSSTRSYRHSRTSSHDASDSSSFNGLCTNSSSLYTDSSTGSSSSLSSIGDGSCLDSSVGESDDSVSEDGTGFDSADGCDSDYHSCCDGAQEDVEDGQQQYQYQLEPHPSAVCGQVQVPAAGADTQPRPLQPALSAPADLLTGAATDLADMPVKVTVVAASTATGQLGAAAVAATAPKAARRSSGGKAVAAVVSAARRVAARLKPLPAPRPRRNKSCPGFAL